MINILDTNIILRYLVGDSRELYEKAIGIFKKAETGELTTGTNCIL